MHLLYGCPSTKNYTAKCGYRLRRSLLISLAKELECRTKMQFKYQLHHQQIQESESAAPCVLQKPIAKQKPFVNCETCNSYICSDHSVVICRKCYD